MNELKQLFIDCGLQPEHAEIKAVEAIEIIKKTDIEYYCSVYASRSQCDWWAKNKSACKGCAYLINVKLK